MANQIKFFITFRYLHIGKPCNSGNSNHAFLVVASRRNILVRR